MALTYIDNSPVRFIEAPYIANNDRDCFPDKFDFCQLMERADLTDYQVDLGSNTGELVTAGDFSTACGVDWTCGAGWAIAAGKATKAAGGVTDLEQPVCIMEGRRYRFSMTIDSIVGSLQVFLGGVGINTYTTTGTKVDFVLIPAAPIDTKLVIKDILGTTVAQIDDVSLIEYCEIGYEIETSDGVSIFTDIAAGTPDYFETKAQIRVDWTQAPIDGCYVICNHQADEYREMVCNGPFFEDALWIKGTGWTIAGGVARFTPIAGGGSLEQNLLHPLLAGRCYTITGTVSGFVGGFIRVIIDDVGPAPPIILGTLSANGAFNFNIDLTGSAFDYTVLQFTPIDPIAADMSIDDISILMQTICYEEDACSECYNLTDDYDDINICTSLVTWTNDDNAFGFEYVGLTFVQRIRLASYLSKPRYEEEMDDFTDNAGTGTILRGQSFKVSEFDIDVVPEYIHDAMRISKLHDTFTIDTLSYKPIAGDYEPNWQGRVLVATSIIEVRFKTEDLVNENC